MREASNGQGPLRGCTVDTVRADSIRSDLPVVELCTNNVKQRRRVHESASGAAGRLALPYGPGPTGCGADVNAIYVGALVSSSNFAAVARTRNIGREVVAWQSSFWDCSG